MSRDAVGPLRGGLVVALVTLLSASGTLVCCALPALIVAVGAGAALAGLVTAVPQLVWLSTHKALVFSAAGALLIFGGALQWHARRLPCPSDPLRGQLCGRLRSAGAWTYGAAIGIYLVGATFAFCCRR
jgi:hypothetical protein